MTKTPMELYALKEADRQMGANAPIYIVLSVFLLLGVSLVVLTWSPSVFSLRQADRMLSPEQKIRLETIEQEVGQIDRELAAVPKSPDGVAGKTFDLRVRRERLASERERLANR